MQRTKSLFWPFVLTNSRTDLGCKKISFLTFLGDANIPGVWSLARTARLPVDLLTWQRGQTPGTLASGPGNRITLGESVWDPPHTLSPIHNPSLKNTWSSHTLSYPSSSPSNPLQKVHPLGGSFHHFVALVNLPQIIQLFFVKSCYFGCILYMLVEP